MTTPLAKTLMIDDNAELARWCRHWQSLPFVAVDTEFVRTETFYPIAGLIQVGDGEQAVLIDPLAITDWAPLVALLEDLRWSRCCMPAVKTWRSFRVCVAPCQARCLIRSWQLRF